GLTAQLKEGHTYLDQAKFVNEGKFQLGIFQGIEFAWAKTKYPDLKPLMVTSYKKTKIQAFLVVKKDGPSDLAGLKGKELGWLKQSREHCKVFLEKLCQDKAQTTPEKFFKKLDTPDNGESALDDILLATTQGAVVDDVALTLYRDIKPGGFNRL